MIVRDHDPSARPAAHSADSRRAAPRRDPGHRDHRARRVAARSAVAGLVVAVIVVAVAALQPARFEGRVGLVALPASEGPAAATSFGEIVSVAMPALPELATSPTLLAQATASVPGGPAAEELRPDVGVELIPASGVARITVRADTPDRAAALSEAVARGVIQADVLAPAADLRVLDSRATVTQVSPNLLLAVGLALLAGLVTAVGAAAYLRPFRPQVSAGAALLDALARAGRPPVAVLDGSDPVLAGRILMLQQAADRPVRVIGAGPGLDEPVRELRGDLARSAVAIGADDQAPESTVVLAVVDGRRTRPEDVTGAVAALPAGAVLLGVVLL